MDTVTNKIPALDNFFPIIIKVFVAAFIIICLTLIINVYVALARTSPILINGTKHTTEKLQFPSNKLSLSDVNKGVSWTFVSWMYVEDWNYKYGQQKNVLNWGDNLKIYFEEKENDMVLEIKTVPLAKVEKLTFNDVPLQRWFCAIIVLDGRNIDLFIDGKLVMSRVLEYVPNYSNNELVLFEDGGFNGKIGYLQYLNYKIPQFGITHFQQLEKKFNGKSPIYSLYSSFMFGVVFGFKMMVHTGIVATDRGFGWINWLFFEVWVLLLKKIAHIFGLIYSLFGRYILG